MELKKTFDPFVLALLLTMMVSSWIIYDVYFNHHYTTFTTEEEITDMKSSEFGFLASFL